MIHYMHYKQKNVITIDYCLYQSNQVNEVLIVEVEAEAKQITNT
jgi:hypothetical protein